MTGQRVTMDGGPWALLSPYDKGGNFRSFAEGLVDLGWRLLASKGTKDFLDKSGIPSLGIADIVGEPILGHRVVTLSREVYAAILARPEQSEDMAELQRIGVAPISLAYVTFYPLLATLQKPDSTPKQVVESIDIGGPTLLRAVAKAGGHALSDPSQLMQTLRWLELPDGAKTADMDAEWRFGLAAAAEIKVGQYATLAGSFYQSLKDGKFEETWHPAAA